MTTVQRRPDNTPVDPDDELLVAYLDGELDRQDQAQLEDRLMSNESLRRRLQELQSGWDLLDALPEPESSLKLVETTLEMVVADIVKNQPRDRSLQRFRFPAWVALACVVGVAVIVSVAAFRRAQHYRQQLQDLAIVEYLDAYLYGQDLKLMRQLTVNADWLNMVAAASEIGDIRLTEIAQVGAAPVEQRDALLRELPPENVDQLNSRWERFNRLDESKRDQVRKTAAAVAVQPDAETLLETMRSYAMWRETLPAQLRDAMEKSEGLAQRDAIKAAVEQTQLSISRRSSLKLSEPTFDAIYVALQQILSQRIQAQDPAIQAAAERFQDDPNAEVFMLARIVFRGPGRGFISRGSGSNLSTGAEPLTEDELLMIRWVLPDRAVEILDLVANGDRLLESVTLRTWAEETVRRKFPRRRDTSTLDRYLEIPEQDRDMIDLLPPERFLNELSRDF